MVGLKYLIKMTTFDLSIFNNIIHNPCDTESHDYKSCDSLARLFTSLQYYSLLNITTNQQHQDIFQHFIAKVYSIEVLLNDYSNFIKYHSNNPQQISYHLVNEKSFKSCNDIKKCQQSSRHHRVNIDTDTKIDDNKLDPIFNLFCQTLDGLHFYIFHLYHVGMRVNNDSSNHDNNDDWDFVDSTFGKVRELITSRQHTTASYDRFPRAQDTKSSKFNINVNNKHNLTVSGDNVDGTTYLDTIYKHLMESKIDRKTLYQLQQYLSNEEFCTESVDYDVNNDDDPSNGNIAKYINNPKCIQSISEFMNASRGMSLFLYCTCFYVSQ